MSEPSPEQVPVAQVAERIREFLDRLGVPDEDDPGPVHSDGRL